MPRNSASNALRVLTCTTLLVFSASLGSPAAVWAQTAEKGAMQERDSGAKGKGKSSSPSQQMHRSMMEGMKETQKMRMSGDMDRDFAIMMRKHHQDGVKMSQYQIEHGKDAKMREMAQKITANQKKEIAEFDEWLKSHPHGGTKQKK